MNILHVSLGLPPLRTGGLTRYCTELIEAQLLAGNSVSLLYPGRFLPGKIRYRTWTWHGVNTCELINPLPVALTFGVADPDSFIKSCPDVRPFERLLAEISPDVIHVHSYMGIYREFFQTAKRLNIPIVFTTHDYYPMCPRCTFINALGENCVHGASPERCARCCQGGMSLKKSVFMQTRLYARLKSTSLTKKAASAVKEAMSAKGASEISDEFDGSLIAAYKKLLDYNKSIYKLFDLVLTNSKMTEGVYRQTFPLANYYLTPISHRGLTLSANTKTVSSRSSRREKPVIGYFGGRKTYKGFEILIKAARILHEGRVKFEMRLYGDDYGDLGMDEVMSCGYIEPDGVPSVLHELDVVVVPSICRETFGFMVLEALSEGVRVICSDVVGACDLLPRDAVFPAGDAEALSDRLKAIICNEVAPQAVPDGYPLAAEQQVIEMGERYLLAMQMNLR